MSVGHNGDMMTMNEPQVWTLIGVFAASMVGIIGLVLRIVNVQFHSLHMQMDSMRSELKTDIGSVRIELWSDIANVHTELRSDIANVHTELTTEISSVRTEISAVRTELQADIAHVRTQITHLDRDVQAISKRVFPE